MERSGEDRPWLGQVVHPLSVQQCMTTSSQGTQRLGRGLGRQARCGDFIACYGTLGAGKTTLIQGFAEGLEVPREAYVRSPTFALMHQYDGRIPLYHFDFYRLVHAAEVYDLAFEEYCDAAGVVIVEWAGKFPELLPDHRLDLAIRVITSQSRTIRAMIYRRSYERYLLPDVWEVGT